MFPNSHIRVSVRMVTFTASRATPNFINENQTQSVFPTCFMFQVFPLPKTPGVPHKSRCSICSQQDDACKARLQHCDKCVPSHRSCAHLLCCGASLPSFAVKLELSIAKLGISLWDWQYLGDHFGVNSFQPQCFQF